MEAQDQQIMVGIKRNLYHQLETKAAKEDIPLGEYIEKALEQALASQEKVSKEKQGSISREAYENILRVREEIRQDRQGRPFDDSTDIIRQMREERAQYLGEL
jgi:hypothetical protein